MTTIYRVVPASTAVSAQGGKQRSPTDAAAAHYETIINKQAAEGWQFVCFDSTTVHRVECCNNATYTIKLIVFQKEQ